MKREQVEHLLTLLPEEFHLDDLIEKLIFVEKIEEGLRDIKEGRVFSQQEMEKFVANLKRNHQEGNERRNAA